MSESSSSDISVPADGKIVAWFATKGSGTNDAQRIAMLLSRLPGLRELLFDKSRKRQSAIALLRSINQTRPALLVMEGTGIAGGLVCLLARLWWRIPYIVSSGDAIGPLIRSLSRVFGPLFSWYERVLCRGSAGFIGWTPYLCGRALTFGSPQAMTAPGWPLGQSATGDRQAWRARWGISEGALVVGLVGSLTWSARRGYCYGLDLVKVASRLQRRDLVVVIVGEGDGLNKLREAAGSLLGTRVMLPGAVKLDEVVPCLSAFDVAALPQSTDGVGSFRYTTKLCEYAVARLPVITTRIPLAYDLGGEWMWRLPGEGPWQERYLKALTELLEGLDQRQISEKRQQVPKGNEGIRSRKPGAASGEVCHRYSGGAAVNREKSSSQERTEKAEQGRLGYLDVYRGIACLLVYFYHTAVNFSIFGIPFYGYHGVHLFFVLSGYLMAEKLLPVLCDGKPMQAGCYLRRRLLRIYPPYLVCVVAFVCLRMVSQTNVPSWQNIGTRVLLCFNYLDRYDYFAINPVFWSLAVEVQFYLLLPAVIWLGARALPVLGRAFWLAGAFLLAGLISRGYEAGWVVHDHPAAIAHIRFKWVTSHLDLFGSGILWAAVERHWLATRSRMRMGGGIAGITGASLLLGVVSVWTAHAGDWQSSDHWWFTVLAPVAAALAFALMLGSTSLSSVRELGIFQWKWLRWIGLISYSVYLYHVGVLFAFNKVAHPADWGLSWTWMTLAIGLCCLPPTLFLSWVAYRAFEVPAHRWARGEVRG